MLRDRGEAGFKEMVLAQLNTVKSVENKEEHLTAQLCGTFAAETTTSMQKKDFGTNLVTLVLL